MAPNVPRQSVYFNPHASASQLQNIHACTGKIRSACATVRIRWLIFEAQCNECLHGHPHRGLSSTPPGPVESGCAYSVSHCSISTLFRSVMCVRRGSMSRPKSRRFFVNSLCVLRKSWPAMSVKLVHYAAKYVSVTYLRRLKSFPKTNQSHNCIPRGQMTNSNRLRWQHW